MADESGKGGAGGGARRETGIVWDDSRMETNFANVVNIQGTREQVELFFGTNRTWNMGEEGPVKVDLTNRMILTPLAAKRLWSILGNVLREYEQRHGALKVDGG
jgi:hypothetical protein